MKVNSGSFSPLLEPRSRNECMHLCSMKQSFYRYGCVNHYDIVTRGWLRYLARWNASFDAEKVRYCDNSDGNDAYPAFVQQRRLCQSFCSRDCLGRGLVRWGGEVHKAQKKSNRLLSCFNL